MDSDLRMTIINTPFKSKKIPYYLVLILLTLGASLILGFLSFSGMFALVPALSLAITTFILSVAYEGEIYLQNIKGALGKLLKTNYLENTLAKDYLLNHFPENTDSDDTPQFFKDYEAQLQLLSKFGHKNLNKESKQRKKQIEKTLKDMEKWFALQLFPAQETSDEEQSKYISELREWLNGCDLHLMSQLPKNFAQYKNSYLFIKKNDTQELYYINSDGEYEKEKIVDFNLFEEKINTIKNKDQTKLHLSKEQVKEIVASNGGHSRLNNHQKGEYQILLTQRGALFKVAKGFSLLASLFMGVGSTYLIVEAFSAIPLLAAIPFTFWPIIILPMAIIAGAAYGFLTYNAITDLINNDTLRKWYIRLRDDLSQGLSIRNVFMTLTAGFLATLAIALTICTAGTWWTIATTARPLFDWMKHIPSFIMGIINPLVTGASAIFFNLQNTAESLDMVDELTRSEESIWTKITNYIKDGINHLLATENWLQIINPFRLLLKITVMPLRILLFLGHLISISLTADRMPGVPQILAALVAMISEGFEDAHYFIGHSECAHHDHSVKGLLKERLGAGHSHSHDVDIPTRVLRIVASPLYLLSTLWDFLTSKLNPATNAELDKKEHHHHDDEHDHHSPHHDVDAQYPVALSFGKAWNKQWGIKDETEVTIKSNAKRPSASWQKEQALFAIEQYKSKHLDHVVLGAQLAQEKKNTLTELQQKIRKSANALDMASALGEARRDSVLNQHRLFNQGDTPTNTQLFVESLSERVNLSV